MQEPSYVMRVSVICLIYIPFFLYFTLFCTEVGYFIWGNLLQQQKHEDEGNKRQIMKAEERLKNLLTPQYSWLFIYLGRLERGVKFLVDLRTDVLVCWSVIMKLNFCIHFLYVFSQQWVFLGHTKVYLPIPACNL